MASNNPLSRFGLGGKKKTTPEQDGAPSTVEKTKVTSASEAQEPQEAPLFSIVGGNPTEEEVVALTMAVVALQEQQKNDKNAAAASWQRALNRGQKLGVRLRPGPGSWRRAQPM